jgi:proline dehydrogenase
MTADMQQNIDRPLIQTMLFPLAKRFVAGDNAHVAMESIKRLNADGFRTTVALLGEDVHSSREADSVADQQHALIDCIARYNVDTNISLKLSSLGQRVDNDEALRRFCALLEHASNVLYDPFIRIDMEGYERLPETLQTFEAVWKDHPNTGPVLQAQLLRTPGDVERMIELGVRTRLCKGAYREPASRTVGSIQAVRTQFVTCAEALLERGVYCAIATHDDDILERLKAFIALQAIKLDSFEFQMLYGVRPDLQRALAAEGYRVRIYVPYGTHWAKYFRRRVMERPENLMFALQAIINS